MQIASSDNWAQVYTRYKAALHWLESLITDPKGERYLIPQSQDEIRRAQEAGLARTARFLDYLGTPQQAYHTVHVAGTGGKGSVATMIAAILHASGVSTGLHTSPYLQVPNEKLVANGKLISPSGLVELIEHFRPLYDSYAARFPGDKPKYGEAWVALTHLFFRRTGVEWVSLETGMGGRFDPTNAGDYDLAVITNVDFDHVPQLGTTLPEIAWHKAGIIKPGKPAITGETRPEALEVIEREAALQHAELYRLGRDYHVENLRTQQRGTVASIRTPFGSVDDLFVGLLGEYQATNAGTAIMSAFLLRERHGLAITEEAIREAMSSLKIAGRMEVMQDRPLVVIDGAHNPQKMRAAASALRHDYGGVEKTLVIGMLQTKDALASLTEIVPVADRVIATEARVIGKPAFAAGEIADLARKVRPGVSVAIEPDVQLAIKRAIADAGTGPSKLVFVTGSIYMLGKARELWHPQDELLRRLEYGEGATLPPSGPTP
ncbi:MAG: bifunctional folylpolyglutamate synthase/dihydrofolate synthase [Chloroflexota bacterium]|nr:bifunctional folylpolyglutamate synthase/dihydrofolate synthase [Chloroflexota bacterium]MDQ5866237.1 bifunctional folylpolyglutamate synthase/dihydrofolate synthase [Chloroflexota bacterium]